MVIKRKSYTDKNSVEARSTWHGLRLDVPRRQERLSEREPDWMDE